MPSWWLEATLPGAVFGALFLLWIAIPNRSGEGDLGSKIRDLLWRR